MRERRRKIDGFRLHTGKVCTKHESIFGLVHSYTQFLIVEHISHDSWCKYFAVCENHTTLFNYLPFFDQNRVMRSGSIKIMNKGVGELILPIRV